MLAEEAERVCMLRFLLSPDDADTGVEGRVGISETSMEGETLEWEEEGMLKCRRDQIVALALFRKGSIGGAEDGGELEVVGRCCTFVGVEFLWGLPVTFGGLLDRV